MGYPIDHVLSNGTIYVLVQEESASTKKLVGVYIPKKDHILLGDGFILDLMTPDGGLLVSDLVMIILEVLLVLRSSIRPFRCSSSVS
jgi:hypothetical protein